jgi:hypothetical protein
MHVPQTWIFWGTHPKTKIVGYVKTTLGAHLLPPTIGIHNQRTGAFPVGNGRK